MTAAVFLPNSFCYVIHRTDSDLYIMQFQCPELLVSLSIFERQTRLLVKVSAVCLIGLLFSLKLGEIPACFGVTLPCGLSRT